MLLSMCMQRPPLSPSDEAMVASLATRKPSELVSLQLELARRLSAKRRPADVLAQWRRDPHVAPSALDQRLAVKLDRIALDAAPEYEALLLSPVAPLATCAALSPTTQDRSVTTSRTTEVVSDPTNVLALACARRLAEDPSRHVRLCTVHQTLRPQKFPPNEGFSQHFRLFALVEAGASRPEHGFEGGAIASLAGVFVRLFDLVEAEIGCRLADRSARLLLAGTADVLGARVVAKLREVLPDLPLESEPFASGYYDGLRLVVGARAPSGAFIELGDIGVFDWMAKLTSNARMRFVAGGVGIQLLPLAFR